MALHKLKVTIYVRSTYLTHRRSTPVWVTHRCHKAVKLYRYNIFYYRWYNVAYCLCLGKCIREKVTLHAHRWPSLISYAKFYFTTLSSFATQYVYEHATYIFLPSSYMSAIYTCMHTPAQPFTQ